MLRLSQKVVARRRDALDLVRRKFSSLQHGGPVSSRGGSSRVSTSGHEPFSSLDPSQHRRQHQLAAADTDDVDNADTTTQHREAIQLFLESLQPGAGSNAKALVVAPLLSEAKAAPRPEMEQPQTIVQEEEEEQQHLVSASSEPKKQEEDVVRQTNQKEASAASFNSEDALLRAIRRRQVKKAILLFKESMQRKELLPPKLMCSFFYMVVKIDPFMAYTTKEYYHAHPDIQRIHIDMYRKLCQSIGLLGPQNNQQSVIRQFVDKILSEVEAMDMDAKKELYPKLVAALATQRSVGIGPGAGVLYKYMVENEFEMTVGWLRKLLSLSKYNRQEDLPFHDVLARLVALGSTPHPFSTLPAIHNMFPYTDSEQMSVALNAILELQQKDVEEDSLYREHLMDLATLEYISTGAAHAGNSEVILLVWDILENCNYKPTETIYENTVVAFAAEGKNIQQVFAAIASMKEDGFELSRPLIRSVSRAIRPNRRMIDAGLNLLTSRESSSDLLSLESLNVIMSSYAERGDTQETMNVLKTMKVHNLKPDGDSYSFAIESLGKDIHRRKKADDVPWVHKNLEIAASILTMMEEDNIVPSADVVRNYVELLCITNEVSTATSVVNDCLANGQRSSINNIILYRVAMANAEAGNIEMAKELASLTSETIPVLHRKIQSKEQRHLHLQRMKEHHEKEGNSDRTEP